jgi:hypothetical protein
LIPLIIFSSVVVLLELFGGNHAFWPLVFGIQKPDVHLFQIFASVLCDLLWFHRNKVVHEGSSPNVLALSASIKKVSLEHLISTWKVKLFVPTEKWFPPDSASFKVNFDTAIRENFSAQSAICRDHNGNLCIFAPP